MRGHPVPLAAGLLLASLATGSAALAQPAPAPAAPAAPAQPAPGRPGREVSFPPSEVKDTFFAYFLGIIAAESPVDMDNGQMRSVLVEFKSTMDVPFDLISRVTQQPDPQSGRQVIGLEFTRDVAIPVPFALLFYHPGSIFASRYVSFDVHRRSWADPGAAGPPGTAFDLVLSHGTVLVDIDDWLEGLTGGHLEDAWIEHAVFFKWHGDWIGMLTGIGRATGRQRRAFFDFTDNRILFPASNELTWAGEKFVPPR